MMLLEGQAVMTPGGRNNSSPLVKSFTTCVYFKCTDPSLCSQYCSSYMLLLLRSFLMTSAAASLQDTFFVFSSSSVNGKLLPKTVWTLIKLSLCSSYFYLEHKQLLDF